MESAADVSCYYYTTNKYVRKCFWVFGYELLPATRAVTATLFTSFTLVIGDVRLTAFIQIYCELRGWNLYFKIIVFY